MANLRTRRPRLDPASFIAAAEAPAEPTSNERPESRQDKAARVGQGRGEVAFPWEQPEVRADVIKPFNLRLPEPLKLKLDYIRKQTRVSVHEFVMAALTPAVDAEIERLQRQQR